MTFPVSTYNSIWINFEYIVEAESIVIGNVHLVHEQLRMTVLLCNLIIIIYIVLIVGQMQMLCELRTNASVCAQ